MFLRVPVPLHPWTYHMCRGSGVRRKFSWGGGFIQWHMVVICIWCALFVTSQFDAGTEFAKKVWGDNPYCLRFDDVTMFAQP